MWKFKFWLAIAKMYNRLADVTLGVSRFLVERGKHGIKKHKEYNAYRLNAASHNILRKSDLLDR